jgi:Na+-translocating ferredoxin:NAD+ oxidoreductase subunit G
MLTFSGSFARLFRRSLAAGLAAALLAAAATAGAVEYWKLADLLGDFFKTSKKISYKKVALSDAEAADIAKKLGVSSIKKDWSVYIAESGDKRDGYAIKDDEIGLHDPIDFAVRFDTSGVVSRVDILVYREAYGGEVRSERFLRQFVGKKAGDPILAGKDIDIISGATYSSKSMAVGVKRDVLILDAARKNGAL